jgi:hypothetical protein
VTIQALIVRWCNGISFGFHCIKGHADIIDRTLTRDEILNIEADLQADVISAQARGPIAARPNCTHWDIEEVSLSIRVSKVTSDMKTQLISQMHDDDLRTFLMTKETWSPQTFNSIDWHASKLALRRLSKNHQMNVVKLCHNYWHTVSRHQTFYGGDRPCCLCQETKEYWRHILSCPSLDADYHRAASWQKVKKDMQMWHLPADFWTSIEKEIQHLSQDTHESTSPSLPFQTSVNPISNHLRAAFKEQNSIKWMNLLKGRMSHKWQKFSTVHVRSKRLDLQAQEWGPKFVTVMWDHSLRIWQFHNDAFHADIDPKVKCYKLEELERGGTRMIS